MLRSRFRCYFLVLIPWYSPTGDTCRWLSCRSVDPERGCISQARRFASGLLSRNPACRHVKDLCGVGANIQGEGDVPLAPTSIGGVRTTMKCAIGSSFAVSMQNSLSGEITAARCFALALALGGIRIFLEAADYYHRRI